MLGGIVVTDTDVMSQRAVRVDASDQWQHLADFGPRRDRRLPPWCLGKLPPGLRAPGSSRVDGLNESHSKYLILVRAQYGRDTTARFSYSAGMVAVEV